VVEQWPLAEVAGRPHRPVEPGRQDMCFLRLIGLSHLGDGPQEETFSVSESRLRDATYRLRYQVE